MTYRRKIGRPVCEHCENEMYLKAITPAETEKNCVVQFTCMNCESIMEFAAVLRDHLISRQS